MKQHTDRVDRLEAMAEWMDSKFMIPGTSIRFGFDSLIGLIPGVGDTFTLASTIYILGHAHAMGLSNPVKAHIIWNGLLDWVVGSIPLLGDIFDVGWKANKKNVALLRKHLTEQTDISV